MNDKDLIYKNAKLGGKVGFGRRPAIVVIDLQKGFTLPSAPAGGDMTKTVEAVNELIDAARNKNIKTYFTRVGYNKDGSDLGPWGHKAMILREFVRESWFYEMDERLHMQDGDVVLEKHWPSAFFGTHFVQMLIATNIDTLIVTGCTTAGCVYATTVDSCSYGFRTIVVEDGVTDRAVETHNMFLWNMNQKYADVMPVSEVIAELRKISPLEYDHLW